MLCDSVQNKMTFNKCSINGRSYGDAYDEDGNPIDVTDVGYVQFICCLSNITYLLQASRNARTV